MSWIPEAKIYDKKKFKENTMRAYAAKIGKANFKKCSYLDKSKCRGILDTHHINHNRWDNRLENLAPFCHKHHLQQQPAWNKGLTKETDKRMMQLSKSMSITLSNYNHRTGTKHTKETIKKMSDKRKLYWANPKHRKHQSEIAYKRKRKNGAFVAWR